MFSMILTWVGVVLGMVVLLAMAFGAFVVDIDDALGNRRERAVEHGGTARAKQPKQGSLV